MQKWLIAVLCTGQFLKQTGHAPANSFDMKEFYGFLIVVLGPGRKNCFFYDLNNSYFKNFPVLCSCRFSFVLLLCFSRHFFCFDSWFGCPTFRSVVPLPHPLLVLLTAPPYESGVWSPTVACAALEENKTVHFSKMPPPRNLKYVCRFSQPFRKACVKGKGPNEKENQLSHYVQKASF